MNQDVKSVLESVKSEFEARSHSKGVDMGAFNIGMKLGVLEESNRRNEKALDVTEKKREKTKEFFVKTLIGLGGAGVGGLFTSLFK